MKLCNGIFGKVLAHYNHQTTTTIIRICPRANVIFFFFFRFVLPMQEKKTAQYNIHLTKQKKNIEELFIERMLRCKLAV